MTVDGVKSNHGPWYIVNQIPRPHPLVAGNGKPPGPGPLMTGNGRPLPGQHLVMTGNGRPTPRPHLVMAMADLLPDWWLAVSWSSRRSRYFLTNCYTHSHGTTIITRLQLPHGIYCNRKSYSTLHVIHKYFTSVTSVRASVQLHPRMSTNIHQNDQVHPCLMKWTLAGQWSNGHWQGRGHWQNTTLCNRPCKPATSQSGVWPWQMSMTWFTSIHDCYQSRLSPESLAQHQIYCKHPDSHPAFVTPAFVTGNGTPPP